MPLRETIETIINLSLALGFIIMVIGIGLWIYNLSQQFSLSIETLLIILGCVVLIFGALAAKLFTKVGS